MGKKKTNTIIVYVGRLGKTLTISKVLPIIESGIFDHIYIVREEKGIEMPNVTYLISPFLKKIKPGFLQNIVRHLSEPILLTYYSIRIRPQLINSYQLIPKALYTYFAATISRSKSLISSVGGIPEIEGYSLKWFWRSINIFVCKRATMVTTKGHRSTKYMVDRGVNPDRINTFNGGLNFKNYYFDPEINKDIDVLFVGAFTPLKGPDRVLNVINNLLNDYPNIKAAFLGTGVLQDHIKSEIKQLGLENQIELPGHVDNTHEYFKRSRLLLMPSSSEGLATAMIEAMACGCVPVVSNVGNMTEAAFHGYNSMVVDNYMDIKTFTSYCDELLSLNEKWSNLSKNAIKTAQNNYSDRAQAIIFKSILDKMGLD